MPPKAKFTRDEIIDVALDIVRENGIEAITARELGKRLNASSRPIFTVFENMEEVQQEVILKVKSMYSEYIRTSKNYFPEFKKIGMLMIQFAIDEPKLFQLLFMREPKEPRDYNEMIDDLGTEVSYCIEVIQKDYGLDEAMAKKLFEQLWLHAYSISVLCAIKSCTFTEQEISQKLGEVFAGMILLIQSGKIERGVIQQKTPDDKDFNTSDLPFKKK